MACPQCLEDDLAMWVDVVIQCPIGQTSLSKSAIRKKEIKIILANWDKARYICQNCNYRLWPNEVRKLNNESGN